jgi:phosphopentomutase
MPRAFILVLDSFGIGESADAPEFGDEGADTLGHIVAQTGLRLPHLARRGLGEAARASTGRRPAGWAAASPSNAWGYGVERSRGKDTPSGHWEMAGCPVSADWGYFPRTEPCFPATLTEELIRRAGLPGLLGNRHASGTQIIEELGPRHLASGMPIVYTSADSVFQIAAHEDSFGIERLYEVCRIARELVDDLRIGRVIARPFVGSPGGFRRTGHRRDYAVPPPGSTLLDRAREHGNAIVTIGKIGDIFAHRATGTEVEAHGNHAVFAATLAAVECAEKGTLVFANFNDFDTLFGHRRDPAGYAAALATFDGNLPRIEAALRPGDLAVITADHGCDPTWRGTDHTREHVPILAFGPNVGAVALGRREGFADIGQSVARHLGISALAHGTACF